MIVRVGLIADNIRGTIICCNYYVDATIIIQIAACKASPYPCLLKHVPSIRRRINKAFAVVVQQHQWLAITKLRITELDRIEIMTLGDDQVLPAVVVVVEETSTPTGVQHADVSQIGVVCRVCKCGVTSVLKNGIHLIGEIIDENVRLSIIVIV